MAGGGSVTKFEVQQNTLSRVPNTKPPFTVGQLKKAIPPHCFEHSLLSSFYYVVSDLSLAFILYTATTYFHLLPHPFPSLLGQSIGFSKVAFSLGCG